MGDPGLAMGEGAQLGAARGCVGGVTSSPGEGQLSAPNPGASCSAFRESENPRGERRNRR